MLKLMYFNIDHSVIFELFDTGHFIGMTKDRTNSIYLNVIWQCFNNNNSTLLTINW